MQRRPEGGYLSIDHLTAQCGFEESTCRRLAEAGALAWPSGFYAECAAYFGSGVGAVVQPESVPRCLGGEAEDQLGGQ